MDLDNVVERTIAINEGREPPPDTNEEPPPPVEPEPSNRSSETPSTSRPTSEICPLINRVPSLPQRPSSVKSSFSYRPPSKSSSMNSDLVLRNPIFDTISHQSLLKTPSVEIRPKEMIIDELIAIDVDFPEEYVSEPTVTWGEPMVVSRSEPVEVPISSDMRKPEEIEPAPPVLIMEEYEEMQQEIFSPTMSPSVSRNMSPSKEDFEIEEWQRLERLGMQLGPRRKSVLNLENYERRSPLPEHATPDRSPFCTPSKSPEKESNNNNNNNK